MNKTQPLHNESGFSLIEVLSALGLLTLVALVFGGLVKNQHEQVAYSDDRLSYTALKRDMGTLFEQNNQICIETLRGYKVPKRGATNKVAIRDETGKVLIDPKSKSKQRVDDLIVKDIRLTDVDVHKNRGEGEIVLELQIERRREGGGPTKLRSIMLSQRVVIDSKNKVIACKGGESIDVNLTCVERNWKRYKKNPSKSKQYLYSVGDSRSSSGSRAYHSNIQTGSFKVDKDVTALVLDFPGYDVTDTRCGSNTSTSREKEIHCVIPATRLVIYPGESKKPNGSTFKPGGRFEVKHADNFTVKWESCGSRNAMKREYRKTKFYYDGQLLATYNPNAAPYYRGAGCPKLYIKAVDLQANQIPNQCAVENKPYGGAPPYNLGLKIYDAPTPE